MKVLAIGLLALLLALLAVLMVSHRAAAYACCEYDTTSMVSGNPTPFAIAAGPDGNMWWTAPEADAVVRVNAADASLVSTFYVGAGCHPTGITIGPEKNMWVACFFSDELVQIKVAGTIPRF